MQRPDQRNKIIRIAFDPVVYFHLSHVMRKPVLRLCEQQKFSLISIFVVRCLDSMILLVSITKISSL